MFFKTNFLWQSLEFCVRIIQTETDGGERMKTKPPYFKYIYMLLLSVLTAAGDSFFHGAGNSLAGVALKTVFYFFLFYVFFACMERALLYFGRQREPQNWQKWFVYSKKNILQLSLLLFVVYFVYLLVFYPGCTSHDTVYQIEDLVTGTSPMIYPVDDGHTKILAVVNDHHPVLTTAVFTLFYRIGLLLGDANRGLFL